MCVEEIHGVKSFGLSQEINLGIGTLWAPSPVMVTPWSLNKTRNECSQK